jgi:hypothetical protein
MGGLDRRRFQESPPQQNIDAPPPAPPAVDAAILEEVLRATTDLASAEAALTPAERQSLREVAQRYRGHPLTLQLMMSLVQAVILPQVSPSGAQAWQDALGRIAQTQLDDPVARSRVEAIWTWLQGEPS